MKRTTKVKNNDNKSKTKKENKLIKVLKVHKKKLLMLVLLCLIIYVIYIVVQLIKKPTDTVYVEMGQIEEEESAVGYIIRDEEVLKGQNYKNGIEQIKTEGEKVAKGEAIFRYYSNNEKNLVERIKDLDVKIDEALAKEDTIMSSDNTKVLEEQIDAKINQLYGESNLELIKNNKEEIINNMTKKAKLTGELSPAGSYLNKLIKERSKYEKQLNDGAESLTASKSGVVSYRVDGYEDILTTDDFGKYTKDFLEDLNLKTGQIVPTSSESGKIIDNYSCYVVCVLDSNYAKDAEVGDKLKLRLPSGKEADASIEYKTVDKDDYVITFKIETDVTELISYRKISFGIIWWSENGLKIPNSAIHTEKKNDNEIAYVTRTRIGYQDNVIVKILKQNERYAIVTKYTSEELTELGYTSSEIRNMPNIAIYDEILID